MVSDRKDMNSFDKKENLSIYNAYDFILFTNMLMFWEKDNLIEQEFEECRQMFEQLRSTSLLDDMKKSLLLSLFEPNLNLTVWAKAEFVKNNKQFLLDLLEQKDTDPKFTELLQENKIDMRLRNVFKNMNIATLWDLVKYKSIDEFATEYQRIFKTLDYERKNGSNLPASIERKLQSFMKEQNISWGMDRTLSHKIALEKEKMKKLLWLSFDLDVLDNKRAMKEFDIDNTWWVFTKLFGHGINNFQELLNTYNSIDDIEIDGLGKRAKILLDECMRRNSLSFGMDLLK